MNVDESWIFLLRSFPYADLSIYENKQEPTYVYLTLVLNILIIYYFIQRSDEIPIVIFYNFASIEDTYFYCPYIPSAIPLLWEVHEG